MKPRLEAKGLFWRSLRQITFVFLSFLEMGYAWREGEQGPDFKSHGVIFLVIVIYSCTGRE